MKKSVVSKSWLLGRIQQGSLWIRIYLSNKKEHISYMGQNIKKEKKKDSFNKQYVTFIQKEADHKGFFFQRLRLSLQYK